jgi:glucose-6-phosphate 1-epimerase
MSSQLDVELKHLNGSRASISHQGAQLLSWQTADGVDRLYVSPRVKRDGLSSIRAGVPICFPQFNMRVIGGKALPKHGFARIAPWQRLSQSQTDAEAQLVMGLDHFSAQQSAWPYAFAAKSTITLQKRSMSVLWKVQNTGAEAFEFALAIHSYFALESIEQTTLHGLEGASFHEHAPHGPRANGTSVAQQEFEPLRFTRETDRVYPNAPKTTQIHDGARRLLVEQSENLPDTVVWNPGAELCATLADMPPDGYRHMLCVEAAAIEQPICLQPAASFSAWQRFTASQ